MPTKHPFCMEGRSFANWVYILQFFYRLYLEFISWNSGFFVRFFFFFEGGDFFSEFLFLPCSSDFLLRILSLYFTILTFFYEFGVYITQLFVASLYLAILRLYITVRFNFFNVVETSFHTFDLNYASKI